jgi:hypothetical protein
MNPLRWRKMSWAILVWTAIFVVWTVAGTSGTGNEIDECVAEGVLSRSECEAAIGVGTGIGVTLIWLLWFVGFIVLSIIWFMTRRRGRLCPACGEDVKKGGTTCGSCGYDFAAAVRPAQADAVE